eukprot:gnl/MRDRNA2_/MRDRNA2_72644_c0_seq1.p1 gnl/MRDRNA2_/MRDRNA2_72644_c0~~gnl/MRDRNA2_/MRDRNA2_72644_c0_seq1.p1  ORF type:complete len:579 (+),score=129.55 gnl/MRDRNA2_/MRDRNA2_72644_c0_seq1:82-1818(+)
MLALSVRACLILMFTVEVKSDSHGDSTYALIAGYLPGSDVTQHNMLDLDQAEMETHLKVPDFEKAKAIYLYGGNSGAKAEITVSALAADAAKGAEVKQGTVGIGKMKSAASSGATKITVTYSSVCKDGGLDTKDVSGCFTVGGGAITVGGVDIGAPTAVANKYRTLAGFSTAAEAKMTGQEYFDIYMKYYGAGDYAHQRVMAGLDKTGICSACDDKAQIEIAKKTSAYMNVWMYVVREFEDAIDDCKAGCIDCNDDPVHAWDEGVAFYTGSKEGTDGSGSGKMIHALADKRCKNFGTCTGAGGGSAVNAALFPLFTQGKVALQQGKCSEVRPITTKIVQLMQVPLVQGSLRYAYKVANLQGGSKEFAEGAAFSAAILPRIHACDASAAKVISDNMNMEISESARMASGFAAVKEAFEKTYKCLGINCAQIGGLILSGTEYYEGFAPCGEVSKGSCYNAKGDHNVECNMAEADCTSDYWYKPGYVSPRSGCCHCAASCPDMSKDDCKYYDAPAPAPEPEPAPAPADAPADAPAPAPADAPAAAVVTTTDGSTVDGSVHMQSGSALALGILFVAYVGISL